MDWNDVATEERKENIAVAYSHSLILTLSLSPSLSFVSFVSDLFCHQTVWRSSVFLLLEFKIGLWLWGLGYAVG